MTVVTEQRLVTANTPCCICGRDRSIAFFDTTFRKFRHSGIFHMRKCKECGLLFCSPRPDDEGIAALYDSNYYVFKKTDEAYFERTAEIYARTIAMVDRPTPLSAAEVGSGKGYLLAVLKALGWNVFGIEISPEAAAYGERVFDVPAFTGTLETFVKLEKGSRDWPIVLCIDIIEHVTAPDEFVRGLAQITSEGGHVIIDTPNGGAAHIGIEGERWRGFNPFHIFLFNRENLSRLLERHGFVVRQAFTYNNIVDRSTPRKPWILDMIGRLIPRPKTARTLDECVAQCAKSPRYPKTADASAELAAGLRGENLVIIAQKA